MSGGLSMGSSFDAFDFNRNGMLDVMETAIAYAVMFGDDQKDGEEELLDDLGAIDDW